MISEKGSLPKQNDGEYLFSKDRLLGLSKWPEIESLLAEQNLLARPLKSTDYANGYIELLRQLTKVGRVDQVDFEERFNRMKRLNTIDEHYVIVVIEDKITGLVVGAVTLFLELKFIHQCSIRGRLEDVAVLETYRGRRIGEVAVMIIVELARETYNCYKLSLDCTDELKNFYAKNNFSYGSNMLSIRFYE